MSLFCIWVKTHICSHFLDFLTQYFGLFSWFLLFSSETLGFLFWCKIQWVSDFCFYVNLPTLVAFQWPSAHLVTCIQVPALPLVYSCIPAWSVFMNHRLHVSDPPSLVFSILTSQFIFSWFWSNLFYFHSLLIHNLPFMDFFPVFSPPIFPY